MNTNWRENLDGPKWLPALSEAETALEIPSGLLARMAYQESRFRPEIISGMEKSPVGALGILQLMPQFWRTVRVPIPFKDRDVHFQILEAGKFVRDLYNRFHSWPEALAAYNFGPGNEEKYLEHKIKGLPKETTDYVSEILADVQVPV